MSIHFHERQQCMSETFTKLFSSITASTVWVGTTPATKCAWVTLLAMADRHGRVHGSIPGLAHIAGISIEECQTALGIFLSPDEYSRTKENEGRRIEPIDGGWRLLNYTKFRDMRDAESVKESKRQYMRNIRAQQRTANVNIHADQVTIVDKKVE